MSLSTCLQGCQPLANSAKTGVPESFGKLCMFMHVACSKLRLHVTDMFDLIVHDLYSITKSFLEYIYIYTYIKLLLAAFRKLAKDVDVSPLWPWYSFVVSWRRTGLPASSYLHIATRRKMAAAARWDALSCRPPGFGSPAKDRSHSRVHFNSRRTRVGVSLGSRPYLYNTIIYNRDIQCFGPTLQRNRQRMTTPLRAEFHKFDLTK